MLISQDGHKQNSLSLYKPMVIGNYDEIPDVDGDHFICLTCKNYLKKEKLPPMAHCNKLEMFSM